MPERLATVSGGDKVEVAVIANGGAMARIMTWGAALQDFRLDGIDHSLVLGGPAFEPYREDMRNFGAIVGRTANRIAGGRAPLGDAIVHLEKNEADTTTLHGGSDGSGYVNWRLVGASETAVRLTLTLPDGQAGFPGNLMLSATYSLGDDGALTLDVTGETDAPTFCNMAHHSYWNLDGSADISRHTLQIEADCYLPTDAEKIPVGKPVPVEGTRFDFRNPRAIILPGDAELDHNFCLRKPGPALRRACTLRAGDLALRVDTTEPGLQIYDGNGLATGMPGHNGAPYGPYAGIAIEPQKWPDAPNHPEYPSIALKPGEAYRQVSRFHVTLNRP